MRTLVMLGALVFGAVASACSGDDSGATEAPTTTRQEVAASIPGQDEEGLCNWLTPVEILPDVTCEGILEAGRVALAEFPDYAGAQEPAIQVLLSRVCTGAAADMPMTYSSAEPHIAALADAVIGSYCPGDRANVVEAP